MRRRILPTIALALVAVAPAAATGRPVVVLPQTSIPPAAAAAVVPPSPTEPRPVAVSSPARPVTTPVTTVATSDKGMTRDEALELAFPKCEIKRQTHYLDKKQVAEIAKDAGVEFKSTVVYQYRATKKGKLVGTAYFDQHRVRSLRETLMVVVTPDSKIGRIEVLVFQEPEEYIPVDRWYAQFHNRKLDEELQLNRGIRNVTGATLTARATLSCARRILALHKKLGTLETLTTASGGSTETDGPPTKGDGAPRPRP